MPKKKPKLTPKQRLFVHEYLKDLNATQAAIRAGYSRKTAQAISTENLSKPLIQEAIQKEFDKRAGEVDLTAKRILTEIMKLAFFNIKDLYDENGDIKPINELSNEVACAISAIDIGEVRTIKTADGEPLIEQYTKKIKLWDKRASLELLGKHLKLFTEKHEHAGPNGGPIPYTKIERVIVDPNGKSS